MCMTPSRNDLPPSLPPSSFARTHCLSDPVDPTTYHISSTTPPRGISHTALCTVCTPVFHSSRQPTSSHPPPLSSFQLQNSTLLTGWASMSTVSSIGCLVHTAPRRWTQPHASKSILPFLLRTMLSSSDLRSHIILSSRPWNWRSRRRRSLREAAVVAPDRQQQHQQSKEKKLLLYADHSLSL